MSAPSHLSTIFPATSSDGYYLARSDCSVTLLENFNATLPEGGGFFDIGTKVGENNFENVVSHYKLVIA